MGNDMTLTRVFHAVIFLLLTHNHALPQNITIDQKRLRADIEILAKTYRIPDYSVGFVYRDTIIFSLNRNISNEGKNYLIGSCSKSFTALAVLKLAGEGRISPDSAVRKYLPWFEMKNDAYTNHVTVRDLLNHKSGFERRDGFYDPRAERASDYEKDLAIYIKGIATRVAPGSEFSYSNLNYVLLGFIISNVTGETYAGYMNKALLPETGLKNTYFTFRDNNEHNLIKGYQYYIFGIPCKSPRYRYSDQILPAGYISSNIHDLELYLRILLNKTVSSAGDTLLAPDLMNDLTGGQNPGYAMGWMNSIKDSVRIISHTGLNENYAASLNMCPDLDLGWVVLCNVNSPEFCSRVDHLILSMITGRHEDESYSVERFFRNGLSILVLVLFARLIYNLSRWKKSGFRIGFNTSYLRFSVLISGIILSTFPMIAFSKMAGINISDMLRFSPDFGWGLILTAVLGTACSLSGYFGTYSLQMRHKNQIWTYRQKK